MGIEFTKAYVANGKTYATLREAQAVQLEALFDLGISSTPLNKHGIANIILDQSEYVLDILTTTEKSRPKARAVNGGRKPRKPKTNGTPPPSYTEAQRQDSLTPA